VRHSLIFRGTSIPIGPSGAVLGRSMACKVFVDGEGVSRRHARLTIEGDEASIEDLGSVNGVVVNGKRIAGSQTLQDGDLIAIGDHELRYACKEAPRTATPDGDQSLDDLWDDDDDDFDDGEPTRRDNLASLLGPAAMLASGEIDKAARLLKPALMVMIEAAKLTGALAPDMNEEAAIISLRMARASGEGLWVDRLVELQLAARQPPPDDLLTDLVAVVEEVGEVDRDQLRACVALIRRRRTQLDEAGRTALTKLETLVAS